MKRLRSQWWLHIPAAVMLAIYIFLPLASYPWPENMPIHFNARGEADNWGSPVTLYIVCVASAILMFFGMVAVRETSVRLERGKKRFDWMSFIFNMVMGATFSVLNQFWWNVEKLTAGEKLDNNYLLYGAVLLGMITAVMEVFRKPDASKYDDTNMQHGISQKESAIENALKKRSKSGQKWVYSSSQKMESFVNWLLIGSVVLTAGPGAGMIISGKLPTMGIVMILSSLIPVACYLPLSSFHVQVNKSLLRLRGGFFRIPLLKINLVDIKDLKAITFEPMDYGGWGLRISGGVTAYIAKGKDGVLIETVKGKKYLIGCNDADMLAGAIRAGTDTTVSASENILDAGTAHNISL